MKHILTLLLYLNIYTAFTSECKAQQISLTLNAEKEIPTEILTAITPTYSFSTFLDLQEETSRILEGFQQEGFIDSRIISIKKSNEVENNNTKISYNALFLLGPKFSNITIYLDDENFSIKDLNNYEFNVSQNSLSIPITELKKTLLKLNTLQTEKGDPFAKLYLTEFTRKENTLSARLVWETNNIRKIDSIIIKGYEKFPKSYINYNTGLKKGVIFKSSTIEKASTSINALPFAATIKSPEILFKDKQTSLYLYIEKQKSNNFDGIIGFNTDNITNKLVFNGYLDLQLNNNLNYGETFTLNYKSDGNDQQNFLIKTTLPYILKSPLGIDLELSIFKQAENFATTSQLVGTHYQINTNATGTLKYTATNSTILSEEEATAVDLIAFQKKEIAIGTEWKFYQQDLLFPIKGTFRLDSGFGNRKTEIDKENQLRLNSNFSYIITLNTKNSIFVSNNSGTINSKNYVTNELYRLGGINSIRGFKENTIEANLYTIINTEYRYRPNNSIYIHSIIDYGYIENEISNFKKNMYSYGLGTGFQSNTGLLKLSFANGIIKGQDFKFSDFKIHLSIMATF